MTLVERIKLTFEVLKEKNEAAFIPFITLGDPTPSFSVKIAKDLIEGGADIIELGIPFSDPVADGPTIQASTNRAISQGMNTDLAFELAKKIRKIDGKIPLLFLTYYNIIIQRGIKNFFKDCSLSDVDGVIIVDLPVEEADSALKTAKSQNINLIFIVAPSTSDQRLNMVLEKAEGFLYIVSLYGTTGVRTSLQEITKETIKRIIKQAKGKIPCCVGFGISKPEHVSEVVRAGADGVIVGSAIVDIISKYEELKNGVLEKVKLYTKEMKEATKQ
ncbi:hypothetical protein AC477_04705 [miscellaneous Crenarchaeota group-1 archaeon SG8-32-1]|uniref:Tryptophan synthase alpha chain n=1 Tax=miscellaneous Crenarchaeota group-1 archaeon SG8-32-1 TaxID=1685124 RepID=A0A0M0BQB8_9ARCH|nr:MAG: hypothetical protein AC477_04705 [miscellaneous Crenarchaeota group-1 archaeon SG8-32-1]